MMSSGWGSLEAKSVARAEDTGETTETSTDKNDTMSTKASGLEGLKAMSLREQEETTKGPESIGTDADDGTAIDTGMHLCRYLDRFRNHELWVSFFRSNITIVIV